VSRRTLTRREQIALPLLVLALLLSAHAPAVAETPGRIEAAIRAYLVRVGVLDAAGDYAAPTLSSVLASGDTASGGQQIVFPADAGTAAEPALKFGAVGLFESGNLLGSAGAFAVGGAGATARVVIGLAGQAQVGVRSSGGMVWDSRDTHASGSPDTAIVRPSAGVVAVTDAGEGGGALELRELASDPAALANAGRLFTRDNGSGKTQLCVRFGSGAVQVIATEP
jgi:hypothetical protein